MAKPNSYRRLSVDEFTTPCPVTVGRLTLMQEVSEIMKKNGIRHIPVVDGNKAIGIISDRDVRVLEKFSAWPEFIAGDVMAPDPFTVSAETNIDDVAYEMSSQKIGSALVQDESGEIVGIFTSTDALNALIEILRDDILS